MSESDDEIDDLMCFQCYGHPDRCSCLSKCIKGNIPILNAEEGEDEPLTQKMEDPAEEGEGEPLTQKMEDPAEEGEDEPLTQKMEDPAEEGEGEPLTQKMEDPAEEGQGDEDEILTQLDAESDSEMPTQEQIVLPKANKKKKAKHVSKKRHPQKKLEQLKLKIKQNIEDSGPLSIDDVIETVRPDLEEIYGSKLTSGKLVIRNYLANRRMKWLVVNGAGLYSFDPTGVDERPSISADTWVELLKEDKVCYAQYTIASRYFEVLRPHLKKNTAKCALHAALRQNNGQGGRVYGFKVDALQFVPADAKVKASVQALQSFFL